MNTEQRDIYTRTVMTAPDDVLKDAFEEARDRERIDALRIIQREMERRGLIVSEFGNLL